MFTELVRVSKQICQSIALQKSAIRTPSAITHRSPETCGKPKESDVMEQLQDVSAAPLTIKPRNLSEQVDAARKQAGQQVSYM